jgi:uncharacterized SAM-binding protein YcdF (DUF218 family)
MQSSSTASDQAMRAVVFDGRRRRERNEVAWTMREGAKSATRQPSTQPRSVTIAAAAYRQGCLVNSFFVMLGIETWKPYITALLLPPVPFLLLTLVGARLLLSRRGLGWLLILVSVTLLWLSTCTGAARGLSQLLLRPPAALSFDRVRELRTEVQAKKPIAIVILGAGTEPFAPEYGVSSLQDASLERLRYGVWLATQTGAPMAFSGGVGWAQTDASPEARVAGRIAAEEFHRPIKWLEDESRDTRENAGRTIALLRPAGIKRIVLVTHGYHMERALRAFREAAGGDIELEAAPMGLAWRTSTPALDWMPSARGFQAMREVLRELVGKLAGA